MAMVIGSVRSSSVSAQVVRGGCRERSLSVVQAGGRSVEVAGDHEHEAGVDGEDRTAAHLLVGERLEPAEQRGIAPGAPDLRHRQLDQVPCSLVVAGGERVRDRVLEQLVLLVPATRGLVQRPHLPSLLG